MSCDVLQSTPVEYTLVLDTRFVVKVVKIARFALCHLTRVGDKNYVQCSK